MDGLTLLNSVTTNPDENTAALMLADWLQENGAAELAVTIRTAVALRQTPASVYIVSMGSYSDWGIEGIFSSQTNAEKFMAASPRPGNFNDVEVHTLDRGMSLIESGLLLFSVEMQTDGNGASVQRVDPGVIGDEGRLVFGSLTRFIVRVWAKDEQHAIKIANEKRIAFLADATKRRGNQSQ